MLLFTQTIPRPALWGGTLIKSYFNYPQFPDNIGQSWSFSAQEGEGQSNRIIGGEYHGQTLLSLWQEQPQLFNSQHARFPVIISLVAPEDDLSLQIHPSDTVAAAIGYPSGKNEAWYFLEAEPNASIIYGQNAKDEAQLRSLLAADRWGEIAQLLPVHQGDFVYLPAGIVHALKKGSIVYEIQQATDITYRFYDYHRKDAKGQERELQVEQAIECVDYTLTQANAHPPAETLTYPQAEITTFITGSSFCVRRYLIKGGISFHFDAYQLMTCIKGNGFADRHPVSIGDSFLVTADSDVMLEGDMCLMDTSEM